MKAEAKRSYSVSMLPLQSSLCSFAAIEARLFSHSIDGLSLSFSRPSSALFLSLASSFNLHSQSRKKPSVDGGAAGAAGAPKKDFTTAILERKKSPNRLIVDDATNDDNRCDWRCLFFFRLAFALRRPVSRCCDGDAEEAR